MKGKVGVAKEKRTTITGIPYEDGVVTAVDSRGTSIFSDYEDTMQKMFSIPGTNVLVQMAGHSELAASAADLIAQVLTAYPNDSIENHFNEIKTAIDTASEEIREEVDKNSRITNTPPQDIYAALLISQKQGDEIKRYKLQIGVAYKPENIQVSNPDPEHVVVNNMTFKGIILSKIEKTDENDSVAVGPDSRSQRVLTDLLEAFPQTRKLTEMEAQATAITLIKTFADKNETVHWPINVSEVNDSGIVEIAKMKDESDIPKNLKGNVKKMIPAAYAAYEYETDIEYAKIVEQDLNGLHEAEKQANLTTEDHIYILKKIRDTEQGLNSLNKDKDDAKQRLDAEISKLKLMGMRRTEESAPLTERLPDKSKLLRIR